jgi:hypothetical protein
MLAVCPILPTPLSEIVFIFTAGFLAACLVWYLETKPPDDPKDRAGYGANWFVDHSPTHEDDKEKK